jgi:hypothetical protein
VEILALIIVMGDLGEYIPDNESGDEGSKSKIEDVVGIKSK